MSLGISLVYPDNLAVMADIRLTVDGSPHVAAAGTTVGKVFYELGIEAVVARANGEALRDLAWIPDDGDIVESVPIDTDEGRVTLNGKVPTVAEKQAATRIARDRKRVFAALTTAESLSRPVSCRWLANSTIRIPFLDINPTNVINPTWL